MARSHLRVVEPEAGNVDLIECRMLSIPAVAELLSLSQVTVYSLIKRGSLKATIVRGKYRVRATDLRAYVQGLPAALTQPS